MTLRELNPPEFTEKIAEKTRETIKAGHIIFETHHVCRDGKIIPVEINSRVIDYRGELAVISIARDISERKLAEEQLQQYQRIVAASNDHMALLDKNYVYQTVNDTLLQAVDKSREEVVAHSVPEVWGQKFFEKNQKPYVDRCLTGEVVHYQTRINFTDFGYRYMDVTYYPNIEEDGTISGYVVNARDITEQKELETQFTQAQRMESLGTLAGGIAHDFNNILMGIQGNASLVLLDIDSNHPHYERLKNIEHQVKSGSDLTKQLLGFARGGKYEVRPTDLNEFLKEHNQMFGRTKKEVTIHEKYEKNLWTAEVDQAQIGQVLLNLYINAWQSMPAGGDLLIHTENVELDEGYVKPFDAKPGKYVKISVIDTGVGMDEATRQKIFEPFFTTKEMGRGTGLGLASVYGIIKNHGGLINVESVKGEGTTINIYIPASEKEVIKGEELSNEIITGTETILLVDDEEMIINVGQPMLERMGHKVSIARDGKEAIKIYDKNKGKIDLVILDMIMPGFSGGDTFDGLKEINYDIKVLLASGYSLDGQAQRILDRGCDGFIQKPFNLEELSRKLREILDKK